MDAVMLSEEKAIGRYPVETVADKAIRWLMTAGVVEKDESVIWVEDEPPDDSLETVSVKIIKVGTRHKQKGA